MKTAMRGKIKENPAQEVVDYLIRPGIMADLARSYQTILDVNKAHVIMLQAQDIIEKETARKILGVTRELEEMQGKPSFEISMDVEDLYFNLERYLIERTGIEIGGQQHTARSRNDMLATITRMDSRTYYLELCSSFIDLRAALVELAKSNLHTVMSGYTHLQPSEPITMAHYCLGILSGLERDYNRIESAFGRLNCCPLGGCAMASTSFPIDREITARLLGFDSFMQNSLDSVAARDYVLEIIGAFAIMTNTLSRMAQDLYIWATPEFDFIEVGDCVAVCSSIMPQKKNPITLEHIKAKAAHLEGIFVSAFSALKNTPYTHCRDVSSESVKYYWSALQEVEADLKLATVTIRNLNVKKERMESRARENFCTVTELANVLVREERMSFRAAHEVVAAVVDYMIEHQLNSHEIKSSIVNSICKDLFGMTTSLRDESVAGALDPVNNVKRKKARGGSNAQEAQSQLQIIENHLAEDRRELGDRKRKIAEAKEELERSVLAFF